MKLYKVVLATATTAIVAMTLLVNSINAREEQRVELNKAPSASGIQNKAKNEEWAKYYPRQYDSWSKTKESDKVEDMVGKYPQLGVLWAGYPFSKDYNAPRGHFYAVQDNINTLRTGAPVDEKTGPLPSACWTCKSPDVPRLMEEQGELEYFTGKWAKYGTEVGNSIGCANCHDDKTGELISAIPYLDRGLESAGLNKFEDSTHQEKRSLVCAQCHVEYYFKKTEWTDKDGANKTAMVVTLPWAKGLSTQDMEAYYDEIGFSDWTHGISKTPMIKAQHPDWEFFKTGIHGQKGVSCADCHMPYTQEGAVKYSDHHIQSPLANMDKSCMNCHRESEDKLRDIVAQKYERKEFLAAIAMDNLAKAHLETGEAIRLGATDDELKEIRTHIRHGQWRWDMAVAGHGSFFHAPEEVLKALASANDEAQNARIKLVKLLAKYGNADFIAPDFDTKEKAQKLAGLDMDALIKEKQNFKNTLEKKWKEELLKNNKIDPKALKNVDKTHSFYGKE